MTKVSSCSSHASGLVHDVNAMLVGTDAQQSGAVRIGIDVVSISWFARTLAAAAGQALLHTAFTAAERNYCADRPDRYAARWAAKEAVAKAIGTGFRGLRPADIEILHSPNGRPALSPTPGATWPDQAHAWQWALSLCHENDAALAIAVAICNVKAASSSNTRVD